MKRTFKTTPVAVTMAFFVTAMTLVSSVHAASPAEQRIESAAANNQFSFVMFYRGNDAATRTMQSTIQSTLSNRKDAVLVPVQIGDAAERGLIKQYDATRMPLPVVATVAPNGAVCSVFPRRVTPQQLAAAIVSPGQTQVLKGLQDRKLVFLCAHPNAAAPIPVGVQQFQKSPAYSNRTQVVTVRANDPVEAEFLTKIGVNLDQATSVVAFMAPPGVMVGTFDSKVSFDELVTKLTAAGKCCDDENCKHEKSASTPPHSRR